MSLLVFMATLVSLVSLSSAQELLPIPGTKPPPPTEGPAQATYWLAMSKKIRPGFPYQFSGQILAGESPVNVQFTIMDQDGRQTLLSPPAVTMTRGGMQSFEFDIPLDIPRPYGDGMSYWQRQGFKVLVNGTGQEVKFKHEQIVQYEEKSFSTFIQTDKGMYKPGQKVMFRVLSVFPDLKAITDKPYDVYIKDANDNRIQQWLNVKDSEGQGVLQLELDLADETPIGTWSIVALILGREEIKTFEVEEYVLPKVEVSVATPPFGLVDMDQFPVTVTGTYTHGEPVTDGFALVTVSHRYNWNKSRPIKKVAVLSRKTGSVTVLISKLELTQLNGNRDYQSGLNIKVEANVTENHTGREYSSQPSFITFYETDLRLQFVDQIAPNYFKPGLPYTIYTEVKKQDGTLFSAEESANKMVYFNVTYEVPLSDEELDELNEEISEAQRVAVDMYRPMSFTKTVMVMLDEAQRAQPFPANGLLTLTFIAPIDAQSMNIQAWGSIPYLKYRTNKYLRKSISPTGSFLQLKVGTDRPTVGKRYQVMAEATDLMTEVTFQIYSKGILLISEEISGPPGGTKSLTFDFMVTRDMTPSLSLVAFYLRKENSELVVDAFSFSTDGLFQNSVDIDYSQESAQPGDEVNVTVKAEVNSTVYLLSADKSVVLLKDGNDITQKDVATDMAEYTYGGDYSPWPFMFSFGCVAPYRGSDAGSILRSAGVLFLSDVRVYGDHYDFERYPEMVDDAMAGGPVAATGGNSGSDTNNKQEFLPVDVVRKFFPEVWLWKSTRISAESGGQVVIPTTVPDTLTTWMTTGFSLHPESGLSIVEKPTTLQVTKQMFVTLDLPATMVRGEVFCFTASVFSYYNGSLPILLTFARSDKFNNVGVVMDDSVVKLEEDSVTYSEYLGELEENEIGSRKFCFSPKVIGEIPLKVSALTTVPGLSDGVERVIVSKPEGVPRATSHAVLAELSNTNKWETSMEIQFPYYSVNGSEILEISTSDNILGSMFDSLDELMKMPSGCGEQNMLNFAPNIFLLEFYMNTGTLTHELKAKAVKYMLKGYQKENTYQHDDGGYSAFGSSDPVASTWLTAFVVKCYALAQQLYLRDSELLSIDPKIMRDALVFLAKAQVADGSFVEKGKVFHKDMQGASAAKGVSLTAYTLVAMQEAREVFKYDNDTRSRKMMVEIDDKISKASQYLQNSLAELTDSFDISLTTYALHLVNSPSKDRAFSILENSAVFDGNLKYWERPRIEVDERHQWTTPTDAINIEMTAYGLLVYSMRDSAGAALPIIRWLTKNKGPNAGFYSTQDTIIGLQSLARMGALLYTGQSYPMLVDVNYRDVNGNTEQHQFRLTKSTEMLLQIARLPVSHRTPGTLNITVGTLYGQMANTTVIVEATLRYNIVQDVPSSKFNMEYMVSKTNTGHMLKVFIFAPKGESRSMSIMQIDIPPGMRPNMQHKPMLEVTSRAEIKGDILNLYFNTDKINDKGIEFTIEFETGGGVLSKAEPRAIRLYDYYEPQYELTQELILEAVEEKHICSAVEDMGYCRVITLRQLADS